MSAARESAPLEIRHATTRLALHSWRDRVGPPLLLLHALWSDAEALRGVAPGWSGPVFGLDFSGHGRSAWREGGVYSPELFAADADIALAEIARESNEPVVLAGEGVGAYAALLLAGGRPECVRAALLAGGRGLTGGGGAPPPEDRSQRFEKSFRAPMKRALGDAARGPDPRIEMAEHDPRPPDYAQHFAERAKHVILVGGEGEAAPWWEAVASLEKVERVPGDLATALTSYSR
ncbi:MAG: alpha/beta hydrolase [Myxococcota bacterium]